VSSRITFPEFASISIYHAFDDVWAVMADAQWTHWKQFGNLTLRFSDGTVASVNGSRKLKDSYRVALGASYQADECWRFRVGTAYDKTPFDDSTRLINIPDQDRVWASIGAQYRYSRWLAVELGYAHLFSRRGNINELAPTTVGPHGQPRQSLQGNAKTRADLIGIQLTWDLI
jgi:long-chain fatty acid transport protein